MKSESSLAAKYLPWHWLSKASSKTKSTMNLITSYHFAFFLHSVTDISNWSNHLLVIQTIKTSFLKSHYKIHENREINKDLWQIFSTIHMFSDDLTYFDEMLTSHWHTDRVRRVGFASGNFLREISAQWQIFAWSDIWKKFFWSLIWFKKW